ncbi:hypothetical protein NAEX_08968 [Nannocystis exedens]|nr:hypothetical protein NAEX_08968 [Nannocystis exedens]
MCGGGYGVLVRGGEVHTFNKGDPFIGLRPPPTASTSCPSRQATCWRCTPTAWSRPRTAPAPDYSTRRLHELVRANAELPANQILQRCLDDYGQFRRVDADDITLIVLRRRAA